MEDILLLFERLLMLGVVFGVAFAVAIGLLHLLARLMNLKRPKEERWEEQRISSHRLYKATGPARIAYLILCLEETLKFYGQDFSAWEWILRKLWSIAECSKTNWIDIDAWVDSTEELLPSKVFANSTTETTSAETSKAQALYTQAGVAMMIVVNTILENACKIVCDWEPGTVNHNPEPNALYPIETVERTMRDFGVPLPSNETIQPLFEKKYKKQQYKNFI